MPLALDSGTSWQQSAGEAKGIRETGAGKCWGMGQRRGRCHYLDVNSCSSMARRSLSPHSCVSQTKGECLPQEPPQGEPKQG